MPDPVTQGGSPKSTNKPATRSSLRHSLNLASVGKAIIAGVRSKDSSSDEHKVSKKSKDSSRRLSSVTPQHPRASIGSDRPKRDATPDTKTVTCRRVSGQHSRLSTDEMKGPESAAASQGSASARGSSLRPKTAASSALPKLRPRSALSEPAKQPSPTPARAGARRRLSTSSEEGGKEQRKPQPSPSATEKNTRPISPLPHRAALLSSSTMNSTPPPTPSTPSKLKPPSPTIYRNSSPTRPTKIMKTTTASSTKSQPRPPSSASSSSIPPHTPKSSALKSALTRSAQDKTKPATTPMRNSPATPARDSPSPLARHAQNRPTDNKSAASSSLASQLGNMSHISEANSEDSDEEDVELLLAPIANLNSATPAMPRIQRTRKRVAPEMPSRARSSTLKANTSLLLPPSNVPNKQSSLRPPKPATNNDRTNLARVSILSWEHASLSASQHLGPGEADKMLSDVAAPFSGPTSPTTSSYIELPPSPCLSAIDSPSLGFGSISQVLLPDVTPSPAVHLSTSSRFSVSPDAAGDASATYLRLQLVAAEDLSNERMYRIMAMEEEIHNLKQAHIQQMEEMATHMAYMEKENEQAGYVAALEEQLRATRVSGEQTMRQTVVRVEEGARVAQDRALQSQRRKLDAVCASVLAGTAWNSVRDTCESEIETIQGEREVLSLLLAELEQMAYAV